MVTPVELAARDIDAHLIGFFIGKSLRQLWTLVTNEEGTIYVSFTVSFRDHSKAMVEALYLKAGETLIERLPSLIPEAAIPIMGAAKWASAIVAEVTVSDKNDCQVLVSLQPTPELLDEIIAAEAAVVWSEIEQAIDNASKPFGIRVGYDHPAEIHTRLYAQKLMPKLIKAMPVPAEWNVVYRPNVFDVKPTMPTEQTPESKNAGKAKK